MTTPDDAAKKRIAELAAGKQLHTSALGKAQVNLQAERSASPTVLVRVRVQLIGHFKTCTTEIYLHIVARMAD